jgi:hypothetical protein
MPMDDDDDFLHRGGLATEHRDSGLLLCPATIPYNLQAYTAYSNHQGIIMTGNIRDAARIF